MKFAHLADCHIGGWRDPKMRDLSIKAFSMAVDKCIENQVDFAIIAGDLFNTAVPGFDGLKETVAKLKELKDSHIPVYIVAGSHDFSPSGKTMIDVLENAGLVTNVVKGSVEDNKLRLNFTIDGKTGAKITGILGRKGMLDKSYYESLDKDSLENEDGFKIFVFHTALSEFKPEDMANMESSPLSLLPKDFNYYAGGHVHYVFSTVEPYYGPIVYPGPTFPNNFRELEKLSKGSFFIFSEGKLDKIDLPVMETVKISVDCENKSAEQAEADIKEAIKKEEVSGKVVTLRLSGILNSGNLANIDFKGIFNDLYNKGAYYVMKNTAGASTKEFETVNVDFSTIEDIEDKLVEEHIGQTDLYNKDEEKSMVSALMVALNSEKKEGERNLDFEQRVKDDLKNIFDIK